MSRLNGGYIGHDAEPTTDAAPGIWTLREAEFYRRKAQWPIVFTPDVITGLQIWLDASDASTLYDATTGGSLVAADGTLKRWEDKSGNARHATEATNGPTRKASEQNGLGVLRFDGTNDRVDLASDLSIGPDQTVFVVAIPASTITSGSSGAAIISGGNYVAPSTTTSAFAVFTGSWTGALTNERIAVGVIADNGGITGVFGNAKTDSDISAQAFLLNYSFNSSGNVFAGRFNGQDSLSVVAAGPSPLSTTNTRYPSVFRTVGCRGATNASFFDGDICEIIIYDSALSDTDREAVENYLMAKWAIT